MYLSDFINDPNLSSHINALYNLPAYLEEVYELKITVNHEKFFSDCDFYSQLFLSKDVILIRFAFADFTTGKAAAMSFSMQNDTEKSCGEFKLLEEWLHVVFHKHKVRNFLVVSYSEHDN
jgi:hypothetical protein